MSILSIMLLIILAVVMLGLILWFIVLQSRIEANFRKMDQGFHDLNLKMLDELRRDL